MRSASSDGASGATGLPSARHSWPGLRQRVVSALVLAPLVLAPLYAGPPYSDLLIILAGGIAAWEWVRICRKGRWDLAGYLTIGAVVAALSAGMLGAYQVAGWLILLGAAGGLFLGARDGQGDAAWLGLGAAYLGAACLALLWLRDAPPDGRAVVFWLLAVVWSTDVGAYFAGRAIGGPKLLPAISPKKTWAGLAGGMLAAAAAGALAAPLMAAAPPRQAALSAALAIVAQVGDLFESGLKRRYGVKDSSGLIPGHGGLLDRIDGLLAVALIFGGGVLLRGAVP